MTRFARLVSKGLLAALATVVAPAAAQDGIIYSECYRNGEAQYWCGTDPASPEAQTATTFPAHEISVSANGRLVAYQPTLESSLYLAHVDGTGARAVHNPGMRVGTLALSPDGTRIAYSNRDGEAAFYVVDVETGQRTTVLTKSSSRGAPAWSPDGTQLLYHDYDHPNQTAAIYVVSADGSGAPRQVTYPANLASGVRDVHADWSPKGGGRIAFVRETLGTPTTQAIYVADIDGGAPPQLVYEGNDVTRGVQWSPDGSELAFVRGWGPPPWQLVTVQATGGGLTEVNANTAYWHLRVIEWAALMEEDLVVNDTRDLADLDPEDGRCDAFDDTEEAGEQCTLRAAIEEANARGGGRITFDIEADGVPRIDVEEFASAPVQGRPEAVGLPILKAPITIDGTTQPGTAWVEISGPDDRGDWDSNAGLWIGEAGGGSRIHGLVINGFYGAGLVVQGDECHIEGNRIGTDATGTQARGNTEGRGGLYILGSRNVIAENVIAGNSIGGFGAELMLGSQAQSNQIVGNRIGVGADGRIVGYQGAAEGGGFGAGIALGGNDNVIGGLGGDPSVNCEAPCNLVYGYDYAIVPSVDLLDGWWVDYTPPIRNKVLGNAVGVNGGLQPIADSPLAGPKVWLGAESTVEENYIAAVEQGALTVGSSSVVRGNIIVGHTEGGGAAFAGLVSLGGTSSELRGNEITTSGTNGVVLTGEGGHLIVENEIRGHVGGIAVTNGAGNRIEANRISENELFGVLLSDYFGEPGALLTRNRIYRTGIGIDLGGGSAAQSRLSGDGVTFNDYTDLDDGPNSLLNYPVPLQVSHLGRVVQVEGELWGAYSGEYTVEVFANTSCSEATGAGRFYGAGEHFLGSLTVTPAAADVGAPAFSFVEGGLEEHHRFVTLTASRADLGVTSEFSPCVWIASAEDVARAEVEPGKAGKIIEAVSVVISITNAANGKTGSSTALHEGGLIYATRYETLPDTSFFADTAATAAGGSTVRPEAVAARYWYLADRGLTAAGGGEDSTVTFEVCLDPAGVVAPSSLDEVVLVQRREAGDGLWQPHDTYTSTKNETTYLCAQNVMTLGEFGFGGAEVAFPVGIEDGEGGLLTEEVDGGVPGKVFGLAAAYPNPFSATTTLDLTIPETGPVSVAVYDVLGRHVAVLIDDVRTAGLHRVVFDAASLPSGVYLVRMAAGGMAASQRVTVLR